MTKKEILDYVMNTPYNTNRAVLSSMLDQISGSGEDTSDLSIAEVTVNITVTTLNQSTDIYFHTCNVQDEEITNTWNISINKNFCTKKLYLILYKGSKIISFSNNEIDFRKFVPTDIPTASGNIKVNYPDNVEVTGDGVFNLIGYTKESGDTF